MTRYHGGKQRIGKEIANTIFDISTNIEDKTNFKIQGYCEPFCGMLGVYQHIPELFDNDFEYKAGDMNESVIKMWKAAKKGWVPPISCNETTFNKLKNTKESSAEKGYIGHQFGFGGQYFSGFIGKYKNKTIQPEASKRVINIAEKIQNVTFTNGSYKQFNNLNNFIIYCDPPYSKIKCYYRNEDQTYLTFDHEEFWDWVRIMSRNNIVFVSEYEAPTDFKQIQEKERKATSNGSKTKGTEKIFIHNSWFS